MKYIFTTLLALLIFSATSFSQSLNITNLNPDTIKADYFTEMSSHVKIENISNDTNSYKVQRFELDMTAGHTSYFCWSIDCYSTNVSLSTSNVILTPNGRDSTFYGYLTPYDNNGGIAGTSVVKYTFFNENRSEDTVSVVFVYTASPVSGVKTKTLDVNEFYAYPNPAVDNLNVAFGDVKGFKSGRIIIRNALGSELLNESIDLNSNIASIDVTGIERGVYFYTIQLDGTNLQTKKFAISK